MNSDRLGPCALRLATVDLNDCRAIHLWDVEAQRKVAVITTPNRKTIDGVSPPIIPGLIWSRDGQRCLVLPNLQDNRKVAIWEFAQPNPTYISHEPLYSLQFSPDMSLLAANGVLYEVRGAQDRVLLSRRLKDNGADMVLFGSSGQVWQVHTPQPRRTGHFMPEKGGKFTDLAGTYAPVRIVQVAPKERAWTLPRPRYPGEHPKLVPEFLRRTRWYDSHYVYLRVTGLGRVDVAVPYRITA
jgi:hypothetical protein